LSNTIVIPEKVRELLKKPLGQLIRGEPENTAETVKKIVSGWRGKLVAVGDAVSKALLSMGIRPDVCIVDGRIERRPVEQITIQGAVELACENRAGTISSGAYEVVMKALRANGPIIIRVNGEEDLLGLVVMAEAPTETLMLYGQPREGVVIVKISNEVREFARKLIEASSQR